jgi:uncharacterized membrane protein
MLSVPDPLHPAVVHFPVALAVITPLFALLCALAVQRRWLAPRAWLGVVLLQLLLAGSASYALATGEAEEERVEKVVAEDKIEEHEEVAERFRLFTVIALALGAAGLAPGGIGAWARAVAAIASMVTAGAVVPVGHSGGQLVYEHGAASAYTQSGSEAPR